MDVQLATASPLVHRYTLDEFYALPEPSDGGHYELIAGVLYVVPPPNSPHNMSASRLNLALAAYAAANPDRCVLFFPRAAIWTSSHTYLEPDLFLVSTERLQDIRDGKCDCADLVVEILSPGTAVYDRTAKADTYAALGVRELWLVDLQMQRIEQRVLSGAAWELVGTFAGNEPVRARAFPELEVIPARIFG